MKKLILGILLFSQKTTNLNIDDLRSMLGEKDIQILILNTQVNDLRQENQVLSDLLKGCAKPEEEKK